MGPLVRLGLLAALAVVLPVGQGWEEDSFEVQYLGHHLTIQLHTHFSADELSRSFCDHHGFNRSHHRAVREIIEDRAVAHLGEGRLNEYWHGSLGPEGDLHADAVVHGICRDFPALHKMPYAAFERRDVPLRVIDAFTFFNELDVLEIRLRELEHVVDKFVLVESAHTHTGVPKNLTFEQHASDFEHFDHQLTHIVLETLPDGDDPWVRERSQREGIHRGLEYVGAAPEDLVLVSDVDEIPRRSTIRGLSWCTGYRTPLQLRSAFYYYSFRHRWAVPTGDGHSEPHQWNQPRAILHQQLQPPRLTANHLRYDTGDIMEVATDASWHLSFFGGEESIRTKIESYAHQENNREEFKDSSYIRSALEEGRDLFKRGNPHGSLAANDEPYDLPSPVLQDVADGVEGRWAGVLPDGFDAKMYQIKSVREAHSLVLTGKTEL